VQNNKNNSQENLLPFKNIKSRVSAITYPFLGKAASLTIFLLTDLQITWEFKASVLPVSMPFLPFGSPLLRQAST